MRKSEKGVGGGGVFHVKHFRTFSRGQKMRNVWPRVEIGEEPS